MRYPLERQKKMRKEVSATLKTLRERFAFTQEQIGHALGVDRSTYSYMENGKTMPGIEAMLVFSKLYGLSVDVLLGRKEFVEHRVKEKFALTKEEKTLLIHYRTVKTKQKEELLAGIAEVCSGKIGK